MCDCFSVPGKGESIRGGAATGGGVGEEKRTLFSGKRRGELARGEGTTGDRGLCFWSGGSVHCLLLLKEMKDCGLIQNIVGLALD